MPNNAFVNSVRKIEIWSVEQSPQFIDQSLYRPDPNPIENLWALLKKDAHVVTLDLNPL